MKNLLFVLLVGVAYAEDFPPSFHYLPNKMENSALSADCRFTDNTKNEIDCDYVQLSLRKGDTSEIRTTDSTIRNLSAAEKKEMRETVKALCDSLPVLGRTPSKGGSTKVFLDSLKSLCRHDYTFARTANFFKHMGVIEAQTCKVSSHTFNVVFQRMGKNKWVSSSEPAGLCEVSTVISLEADPKYGSLWTQNQIRMGVGSDSEFCQGFEIGVMVENSWRFDKNFSLDGCRYLEFGLF
jgi:hypothetical protein